MASRESAGKTLRIAKVSGAQIRVDGKLDEPVWKTLEPVTDFVQTDPDQGAPASERTEGLIFYDDENIYFGFRCYDSHPEKIVARLGSHDGRTNSDSMDIFIDTFHDRRTGYYFSVNSRGIQFDAMTNEGRGSGFEIHDSTWDGIWYSASSLESWGWSTEIAIPFKSIRLSRAGVQQWGLNFGRDLVRKNERSYWAPVSRFDGTMKPSKAGTLAGLEDIRVGRNLELIPFVSSKYRFGSGLPELNGGSGNGGLDARYGVTADLTASLAVNPDFGETEADEFTSKISRFEIFFPEKRKFFTEGANYFATPMDLAFSRRIGARLPDGEPQRILQGGKVTGKVGRWTLGALEALTQRTEFTDPSTNVRLVAPAATFAVMRLQRDILQKSALGFVTVNRFQDGGDVGQRENSHAVDLSILHGQHLSWTSQVMVNTNAAHPGVDPQHLGWYSSFRYNTESVDSGATGKFLGSRVDVSHTGFEPETGRWSGDMFVEFKPFINRWGVRQVFVYLNYDQTTGVAGELQDSGADGEVFARLKNFWTVGTRYSYDRVRFNRFTPNFGRLDSTRVYQIPFWRFYVTTNENRVVYLAGQFLTKKIVQFGENFYGSAQEWDLTAGLRLGSHLRWDLDGVYISESLADHSKFQNRRFLISRMNYQFTPKLRARLLTQFAGDHNARNLSVNSLVAYDFTARSALFVGYNRQRHLPLDRTDLGHEVFVKLSYLFSF